jgi:hypothetical protein
LVSGINQFVKTVFHKKNRAQNETLNIDKLEVELDNNDNYIESFISHNIQKRNKICDKVTASRSI